MSHDQEMKYDFTQMIGNNEKTNSVLDEINQSAIQAYQTEPKSVQSSIQIEQEPQQNSSYHSQQTQSEVQQHRSQNSTLPVSRNNTQQQTQNPSYQVIQNTQTENETVTNTISQSNEIADIVSKEMFQNQKPQKLDDFAVQKLEVEHRQILKTRASLVLGLQDTNKLAQISKQLEERKAQIENELFNQQRLKFGLDEYTLPATKLPSVHIEKTAEQQQIDQIKEQIEKRKLEIEARYQMDLLVEMKEKNMEYQTSLNDSKVNFGFDKNDRQYKFSFRDTRDYVNENKYINDEKIENIWNQQNGNQEENVQDLNDELKQDLKRQNFHDDKNQQKLKEQQDLQNYQDLRNQFGFQNNQIQNKEEIYHKDQNKKTDLKIDITSEQNESAQQVQEILLNEQYQKQSQNYNKLNYSWRDDQEIRITEYPNRISKTNEQIDKKYDQLKSNPIKFYNEEAKQIEQTSYQPPSQSFQLQLIEPSEYQKYYKEDKFIPYNYQEQRPDILEQMIPINSDIHVEANLGLYQKYSNPSLVTDQNQGFMLDNQQVESPQKKYANQQNVNQKFTTNNRIYSHSPSKISKKESPQNKTYEAKQQVYNGPAKNVSQVTSKIVSQKAVHLSPVQIPPSSVLNPNLKSNQNSFTKNRNYSPEAQNDSPIVSHVPLIVPTNIYESPRRQNKEILLNPSPQMKEDIINYLPSNLPRKRQLVNQNSISDNPQDYKDSNQLHMSQKRFSKEKYERVEPVIQIQTQIVQHRDTQFIPSYQNSTQNDHFTSPILRNTQNNQNDQNQLQKQRINRNFIPTSECVEDGILIMTQTKNNQPSPQITLSSNDYHVKYNSPARNSSIKLIKINQDLQRREASHIISQRGTVSIQIQPTNTAYVPNILLKSQVYRQN